MFGFRNIDSFIPSRFERMGMLKGKRWYLNNENLSTVLFKPKRYEYGDKKVFCANHYGELLGYILAVNSDIPACKVELAHLSKYYPNIHKERNHGTPIEKDGCISYNALKPYEELEHGKNIIDSFSNNFEFLFQKLTQNDMRRLYFNDNIEVVLASIDTKTREFYQSKGSSNQYIEMKVRQNRSKAIQMMVYDCLFGNNDRHDENWAMKRNENDIEIYPLYDNERVLGLYENQNTIEEAFKRGKVEEISEKILFSRMRVPGEKNEHSNYKDVLKYLLENYEVETTEALKIQLSQNTPSIINQLLKSCEGLPSCYVDFGTRMYKSRYEFARELYTNKKVNRTPRFRTNCIKFEIKNNYNQDNFLQTTGNRDVR